MILYCDINDAKSTSLGLEAASCARSISQSVTSTHSKISGSSEGVSEVISFEAASFYSKYLLIVDELFKYSNFWDKD